MYIRFIMRDLCVCIFICTYIYVKKYSAIFKSESQVICVFALVYQMSCYSSGTTASLICMYVSTSLMYPRRSL